MSHELYQRCHSERYTDSVKGIQKSNAGPKKGSGKVSFMGSHRSARTSGEPIEIGGGGIEYSLKKDLVNALKRMEDLRIVEEKRLLSFAFQLKKRAKNCVLFLSKEFRPEFNAKQSTVLMANNQGPIDIQTKIQELF